MDYLIKTRESYNDYYKQYRAAWCKKSGLQMYQRKDFETVKRLELYTCTRAKKEKVSIDTSRVVGWYRRPNGYAPLFERRKK